jgi:hypothetical protein
MHRAKPLTFVWGVSRCQIRCTCIYQRPRGRSRVIPPGASPPKAHVADRNPPARPAPTSPLVRGLSPLSYRVSDEGSSAQRACTAFEQGFSSESRGQRSGPTLATSAQAARQSCCGWAGQGSWPESRLQQQRKQGAVYGDEPVRAPVRNSRMVKWSLERPLYGRFPGWLRSGSRS